MRSDPVDFRWQGKATRIIPDRVVVRIAPDKPRAVLLDLGDSLGLSDDALERALLRRPDAFGYGLLSLRGTQQDASSLIDDLQASPRPGLLVEPDIAHDVGALPDWIKGLLTVFTGRRVCKEPDDYPAPSDQWPWDAIGAVQAWCVSKGSDRVLVGMIDSGVPSTSQNAASTNAQDVDLYGRCWLGDDLISDTTAAPWATNGHGPGVAGILAATGDNGVGMPGMNWRSRLYAWRTFNTAGTGSSADFYQAVKEILWRGAARGKRVVINYSGGKDVTASHVEHACWLVRAYDALLCACVGNDAEEDVWYPARYSEAAPLVGGVRAWQQNHNVIGVSGTEVGPGGEIPYGLANYGAGAVLAAPAHPIETLGLTTEASTQTGTSFACPFVSGLASLIWSKRPHWTAAGVRRLMRKTAVHIAQPGGPASKDVWRIDAEAAMATVDSNVTGPFDVPYSGAPWPEPPSGFTF